MRIKNLQLRAKAVVEGFYNGLHRSPFHGFSVEFSEYRPYTVGDDLRGLDWKLYARSDRYYIKKFEDETNRRCYLVLDQSKSMGFGSLGYNKIEYAKTLVATMAYYLTLQRDSVGLMTFDERVGEFISAHNRQGHLRQIMVALSRPVTGSGTDLDQPLREIAALVRRRGLVVIVSDMLASIETLQTNLAYLRSRGHQVMILRVLDPGELALKMESPSMVVDMESGREIYLDPEAAKEAYRARFDEHRRQLQAICDALGVDLYQLGTDQPLEQSLFHLLSTQRRRVAATSRAGMLTSARTHGVASIGRRFTMSLLAPLYFLGALAVGLPILFHLIRRQPKGQVEFSSLMFLRPTPPRLTRRSRLDNWFLLLLRALALTLLAAAFARPFLRSVALFGRSVARSQDRADGRHQRQHAADQDFGSRRSIGAKRYCRTCDQPTRSRW